MKKSFFIFLLSLIATAAFAQNVVTGSVKDAATGDPLMGVGVIVSTGGGTVTDADGTYSVNAESNATITFNLLGYADVVETVNGRGRIDVFMKEDINFLDEVVVMGYTTQKKNEIAISYSWQGASAKVLEMEVTSKIEGIVSSIQGCRNIESHSAKGSGRVTAQFKKGADMEMIRFEIATMIRQIYKNFPDGVTYPALSASSAGDIKDAILTFTVNADLPTQEIDTYIQDHIIKDLALVDGVNLYLKCCRHINLRYLILRVL